MIDITVYGAIYNGNVKTLVFLMNPTTRCGCDFHYLEQILYTLELYKDRCIQCSVSF